MRCAPYSDVVQSICFDHLVLAPLSSYREACSPKHMRTIAQQMSDVVEAATAPYQYALSTRAGTECIAHILQTVTEDNPRTTVLSIDGIGAFDLISRKSMLEALMRVQGGPDITPFVRQFYVQPSTYLWESEDGTEHHVEQGEGGEQGDPLMPLLFALGQHASLRAIDDRLAEGDRLMAFLDDVYITTDPERLQHAYECVERVLWRHSRIRVHEGKTQVWNSGGERPEFCDVLERVAQVADPEARVWKGSGLPTTEQGIRVLGTPLGHVDYVETQLRDRLEDHQVLLNRIPEVQDLQAAWALLLHCASARANYMLRVIRPELVRGYAKGHDRGIWTC